MLPTRMLCWQYKNWLRQWLLGLVAEELCRARDRKCLGLVGKTKKRCSYFFYFFEWLVEIWGRGFVYVKKKKSSLTCSTKQKKKVISLFRDTFCAKQRLGRVQGAMQKSVVSHVFSTLLTQAHNLNITAKTLGFSEKISLRCKMLSKERGDQKTKR